MTTKEKIEALDNLIGMVDDNHGTDYDEALKSAKRSLEAWEKVIEEIKQEITYKPMEMWDYRMGLTKALDIIDKNKAKNEVEE